VAKEKGLINMKNINKIASEIIKLSKQRYTYRVLKPFKWTNVYFSVNDEFDFEDYYVGKGEIILKNNKVIQIDTPVIDELERKNLIEIVG
jgi:hypothetical protein